LLSEGEEGEPLNCKKLRLRVLQEKRLGRSSTYYAKSRLKNKLHPFEPYLIREYERCKKKRFNR